LANVYYQVIIDGKVDLKKTDLQRIKEKFELFSSKRYWGDDFDVRFYLISQLKKIQNKSILDIGGGSGIISSELDKSNFFINLDISNEDLKNYKNAFGRSKNVLNCSMLEVSLKGNSLDYVICAHLLEVAKLLDIENKQVIKNKIDKFPTVSKVLDEIHRVLKPNGVLLLTTPNNAYYQTSKLTYDELKLHLKENFENFSLSFYNTFPRLKSRNRKLNMANILPKVISKIRSREKIIKSLVHKDAGMDQFSVSFFVEAKKLT